ncbi:cytochrome P450 [Cynara cardunculus var. scolymus]|uniref:Cytochrome P450 n=1 Tax=Cynara cardunculus var. scolymus TaxID=59895 RepID=A0A103XS13_CYNCS|nr:cytochrome P450 [Cynara cardunculus var. scolymus]
MEQNLSMIRVSGGVVAAAMVVVVVVYAWRFFNWVWLNPKKKERCLRDQGLKGNSYKLLYGDVKEIVKMMTEAYRKPINLTDDIIPRVLSFAHKSISIHGQETTANLLVWTMILLGQYQNWQEQARDEVLKVFGKRKPDINGLSQLKIINMIFLEVLRLYPPIVTLLRMVHKETILGNLILPAKTIIQLHTMLSHYDHEIWGDDAKEFNPERFSQGLLKATKGQTSYIPFGGGPRICIGQNFAMLEAKMALSMILLHFSFELSPSYSHAPRTIIMMWHQLANVVADVYRQRQIYEVPRRFGQNPTSTAMSRNDDLLGILLDSNYKEIEQHGNTKFGLSIDDVIEECKLFYFAGQETTANLLVWTMILLGQHQNWQEQARDEVLKVFGKRKPDIDGLSQLKIINMIFLEVLRLYPPVVALSRMIHKETKLGNLILPAKTIIQMHTMLSHYDHEIWGDDVKEFNPERFSQGLVKATKGQTSYIPFGGGPRICIGQNFAMLEAKMALAMILLHFSFELSSSYSHAPRTIVTLQPQFGAHLILCKI